MGIDPLVNRKFSLISDMHIDHPQPKTPYEDLEETVVVAGDTTNGLLGLKFLQKLRNKGHTVFAVDGNHEHYGNVSQGRLANETTDRFQGDHPPTGMIFDDVPIVLVNGWYKVSGDESLWRNYMNDSRFSGLRAVEVNYLASEQAMFVEQELKRWRKGGLKGVVVTHTAPCTETLDPRYEGERSNEWYWSPYMRDLLTFNSDVIRVWCHGHTHAYNKAIVDDVPVICNPRGYPGENPNWKPLTIDLEGL